jgi:CheY-like chemotaxis protein
LITDVSMRNMDGYELAYRAKKINPSINIQIVCATRANLMRHCINCDCRSPIV